MDQSQMAYCQTLRLYCTVIPSLYFTNLDLIENTYTKYPLQYMLNNVIHKRVAHFR